jgi:AraC family transcriptional regulator
MMQETPNTPQAPRFADHAPIIIAGMVDRYNQKTKGKIPQLWRRFVPYLGSIPDQVGNDTYGVCYNFGPDDSFDYLCGVQVAGSKSVPDGLTAVEIPRKTFAVFSHTGHISGLPATWQAIFADWLPASGCTLDVEPQFERYTEAFDLQTGTGLVEIWIPMKAGPAS